MMGVRKVRVGRIGEWGQYWNGRERKRGRYGYTEGARRM